MIVPLQKDDTLLRDVRDAESRGTPSLWWLGQSGFLISAQGRRLLLDPYLSDSLTKKYAATDKPHVRMTERVVAPEALPPLDLVTSSHNHTDHLDADTLLPIFKTSPAAKFLIPEANRQFVHERLNTPLDSPTGIDAGQTIQINGIKITAIPAAHEKIDRDPQGRCKYLGYILQFAGLSIYHSGDTVLYEGMAELLRPFKLDLALLPINGAKPERRVAGNLNGLEAAQLAKSIGARVVIPCHFEMFEFNTEPPDDFVGECARLQQPARVLRAGERYDFPSR